MIKQIESNFEETIKCLYNRDICKSNVILDIGVGVSSLGYETNNGNNWLELNMESIVNRIDLVLLNSNSRISDINSDNIDLLYDGKFSQVQAKKIMKRFFKYDIWRSYC